MRVKVIDEAKVDGIEFDPDDPSRAQILYTPLRWHWADLPDGETAATVADREDSWTDVSS